MLNAAHVLHLGNMQVLHLPGYCSWVAAGSDGRPFVIALENGFYFGDPMSNGIECLWSANRAHGEYL
jgi:hypothetical protein